MRWSVYGIRRSHYPSTVLVNLVSQLPRGREHEYNGTGDLGNHAGLVVFCSVFYKMAKYRKKESSSFPGAFPTKKSQREGEGNSSVLTCPGRGHKVSSSLNNRNGVLLNRSGADKAGKRHVFSHYRSELNIFERG
jgi:hypothetical protein